MTLGRGSRLRRNACIITFWQRRSPISWRGSLGQCWRKVAATMRASSREWRKISVFGTPRVGCPRRIPHATRNAPAHLPRSASWIEEMEKRSRRRIHDLVALAASNLRPTSVVSRRNSRRHGYLQLVAKTLYTLTVFFHRPRRPVIRGNFIGGVMYSSHQQISSPEVVELRKEAGLWLKELREKRGLSQRQMAEKVGGNYYTFISQLESGRGRIPPDRYLVWAEVLGVEPKFFVRNLLRSYDPVTYSILFGKS
jgi:DNA-binding XRE family transcriptional regulator